MLASQSLASILVLGLLLRDEIGSGASSSALGLWFGARSASAG